MEPPRRVAFRWTYEEFGVFGHEVMRNVRRPDASWQPAVNAYRCATCLQICVDLAGVKREEIDLVVESRSVVLRGLRSAPEPCVPEAARQVLAMEIDYGPFRREIILPADIDTARTTAEHRDGILWIKLPLLHPDE